MQRPDPREFLRSVLTEIEDLPDGFADRLEKLLDQPPEDGERADAIQKLIEDSVK